MIAFPCPSCGRTLRVPASTSGKKARCPACASLSLVPAAEPAAVASAPAEAPTLPPAPAPEETVTRSPLPSGSATLPPAPTAAPAGDALSPPGYVIERELGRGGMGVVYLARQTRLNRPVALKMILSGAHAGAADLSRFRTEAEAIARLQHPNIVQVHEIGEHDGKPFFSLEFCADGSLDRKLNGTPLPPRDAARLVEVLSHAVQAAHEAQVIHRDLKPANILLHRRSEMGSDVEFRMSDFEPKITDFGLAKKLDEGTGQTQSGAVMGTPSYMAPEQAGGKSKTMGPAADIYSLGAILYELLTGRPPFRAATPLETIMQVVADEPLPPSQLQPRTPRDLEMICLKCLQKQPARRYRTAAALADDLHRFLNGELIRARPTTVLDWWIKWAKKRPTVAALSAALGLLILFAIPFLVSLWVQADDQHRKAERDAAKRIDELETANALGQSQLTLSSQRASSAEQAHQETLRKLWQAQQQLVQSPDGHFLVSRSATGATTVWDTRTGRRLFAIGSLTQKVAFCPDDPRALPLLAGSAAGLLAASPDSLPLLPAACLVAKPQCRLASADATGTVTVWDLVSQKRLAIFGRSAGPLIGVAYGPDGRLLAAATENAIIVWDTAAGKELTTLTNRPGKISAIAFDRDGRHLTSLGPEELKVWDIRTGTAVTLPPVPGRGP
jgi:hypothetical protein